MRIRRFYALLVLCAVSFLPVGSALAVDVEITRDKHVLALGKALKAEDYPTAKLHVEELLQLSIALPSSVNFFAAETYFKLCELDAATRYLDGYLEKTGRDGRYYKQALELSLNLDNGADTPQCESKARAEAEAERVKADAAKARKAAFAQAAKDVVDAWGTIKGGRGTLVHKLDYKSKTLGLVKHRLHSKTYIDGSAKKIQDFCKFTLNSYFVFSHEVDREQSLSKSEYKKSASAEWVTERFPVFEFQHDFYSLTIDFMTASGIAVGETKASQVNWEGQTAPYYTAEVTWKAGVSGRHMVWKVVDEPRQVEKNSEGKYVPLYPGKYAKKSLSEDTPKIVLLSEFPRAKWNINKFNSALNKLGSLCRG